MTEEQAQLEQRIRLLQDQRDRARAVAAILCHAFDHNLPPPADALARARGWSMKYE